MTTEIKNSIQTIVNFETLPSQIDFISNTQINRVKEAWEVINNLPTPIKEEVITTIETRIDEYYTPRFEGENGEFLSVSDLDNMF